MNFKQSVQYYAAQYRRFKLDSKSVDNLILEHRNNPTDERKTVLWFNVARLSLDVIIGYFIDKPNKLDNSVEDYQQVAYFGFEKALKLYDIESPTQFNSYFKLTAKHFISEYHSMYGKKDSVVLPHHTDKITNEYSKQMLSNLSIKPISIFVNDEGDTTIEKYLGVEDSINQGLTNWNKVIKPILLNNHIKRDVDMFESYYAIGSVSGQTFTTIGLEYGVSSSAINLIVKKVLKTIKNNVENDDEFKEVVLEYLK